MTGRTAKRALTLAAAFALAISLGACAKNNVADNSLNGAYGANGGPGSPQEFASSVGDRVFFETDFDRTHAHRAGHPRQTSGLAKPI